MKTPPRRRGASPETIPLLPSFISSIAQQEGAATTTAYNDDDSDRDLTSPSKRKKLLPYYHLLGTRSSVAAATTATTRHRRRESSSMLYYLAAVLLCGILTWIHPKESALLRRQPAQALGRLEDSPHPKQSMETFQQQQHVLTQRKNTNSTLALLYPAGLLGGYRNQVIRLISLCVHAREQNLTQLLLPSLLWSTKVQLVPNQQVRAAPDSSSRAGSRSRQGGSGWNTTTDIDSNSSSSKAVLGPWQPIPMDWIFDVDYWNEYAAGNIIIAHKNDVDSQQGHLPALVRLRDLNGSDCWEKFPESVQDGNHRTNNNNNNIAEHLSPLQRAVWQQGTLGPLSNLTQQLVAGQLPKFNPRKQDFLPAVQHCRNPVVYGGGRSFGRLWNDYIGHHKKKQQGGRNVSQPTKEEGNSASSSASTSSIPYQQDVHVLRALRPAPVWREVGQQCVQRHVGLHANSENSTSISAQRRRQQETTTETITTPTKHSYKYVALHARIELEMMAHACGKHMEFNLTKIVQQVQELAASVAIIRSDDVHGNRQNNVHGLFVAVSRSGMQESGGLYRTFRAYADDNLQTLDQLVRGGATAKKPLPVFECGENMLEEYYQAHPDVPDHGSLLQSVINFDIAVNADLFVGVRKSSYSTDVWTTRYHQGKGDTNYEYTKSGTRKIENGGLPVPHINCKNDGA
jgi:hypothetical protein